MKKFFKLFAVLVSLCSFSACGGGAASATSNQEITVIPAIQPASTATVQGAARVPFTTVSFTAGAVDVPVNSITVERTGISSDGVLSKVFILDEYGAPLVQQPLDSAHRAVLPGFVVKAGTTKVVTIAANITASPLIYGGQMVSISVMAIDTTAKVNAVFPITGATYSIASSGGIGTLSVRQDLSGISTFNLPSVSPTPGYQKVSGGSAMVSLTAFQLTAGPEENIHLSSISLMEYGFVNSTTNCQIYVGSIVASIAESSILAGGGVARRFSFASPYIISSGGTVTMTLKCDVYPVPGLFAWSIAPDQIASIVATGGTYGFGVIPTPNSGWQVFTRDLQLGDIGGDVYSLQQVLNRSADTQVAASGDGSPGMENGIFDNATYAAVIKFQNKYSAEVLTPVGLTAGDGIVGASTRAKLNTMGASDVAVTVVP